MRTWRVIEDLQKRRRPPEWGPSGRCGGEGGTAGYGDLGTLAAGAVVAGAWDVSTRSLTGAMAANGTTNQYQQYSRNGRKIKTIILCRITAAFLRQPLFNRLRSSLAGRVGPLRHLPALCGVPSFSHSLGRKLLLSIRPRNDGFAPVADINALPETGPSARADLGPSAAVAEISEADMTSGWMTGLRCAGCRPSIEATRMAARRPGGHSR